MEFVDPGAGVTTAAPPVATGSGVPGSPPDGSVGAPPAPSPESVGLRQLREQYEQTRSKLEPWERTFSGVKPEEASRSHQTYTKLFTEANTLGSQLGLTAEVVRQYFEEDPVGTLAQLRQAAQERQPQSLTRADLERIAEQKAKELMQPFQQREEQRLDSEAEQRFDGEFDRQFKTGFPNGLPDSNREALQGLAWQLLIDNKDAYGALRTKGDASSIAAAFEQAKKTFLTIVADYAEHEKKRMGNGNLPPTTPTPPKGKSRSFAEIAAELNDDSIPLERALGR